VRRERESKGWLVCKKGGVKIFRLVKDRSLIYREVMSPKLDCVKPI